ncbi:hypothetical protein BAUCODRAFT_160215 [Baudoinia panamericana UAMH 10762]|uniref:Uncharacterized protein n=1 Tax=Baudoinia panamericana (strain UAMH 10762) TaxID=717646 RepID=M2M872_BAUPA|nr:uncharacterized protein BAUCODRAFT_160215 [Baudoinia panamericana UAMH 10762]EMC92546.1 hypothetical protein BAUCODRAFT_160215 [Baudoinia panamericana UAMH 10762]
MSVADYGSFADYYVVDDTDRSIRTPQPSMATKSVKARGKLPASNTITITPPRRSGRQTTTAAPAKAAKKEMKEVVPKDWVGQETGAGTTSDRPDGAQLSEPWNCANRNCSTGLTWWPRTGTGTEGFGRKSISDYFGRNKKQTTWIHEDVWHTYCRKDYQRLHYRAKKKPASLFRWHVSNVRMQFRRLRLWRPDATFKVQLTKNMHERSAEYHRMLRSHNQNSVLAKRDYNAHERFGTREPAVNKRGQTAPSKDEAAFPVEHVDSFTTNHCGDDYDYDDCEAVLQAIEALFANHTISQMPPIEFLISEPQEGEHVTRASTNYMRYICDVDGDDYDTPPGSEDGSDDEADRDQVVEDDDEAEDEDDEDEESQDRNTDADSEIRVAGANDDDQIEHAMTGASVDKDDITEGSQPPVRFTPVNKTKSRFTLRLAQQEETAEAAEQAADPPVPFTAINKRKSAFRTFSAVNVKKSAFRLLDAIEPVNASGSSNKRKHSPAQTASEMDDPGADDDEKEAEEVSLIKPAKKARM